MIPVIGESEQIKNVVNVAQKIARNATITTLIIGENGTGKEVIARLIHDLSSNADQPFIDINCGALPESLLESELFGHEKGSFTGAYGSKKGLFELAHSGTVFLDEIANTNMNFQSKLLKAVETKRFRRVGGINEIEICTRIIAATNIDIHDAVKRGNFREDLFYRLNIGQITVPPLRERGNDVMVLANFFLDSCNKEYECGIKGFTREAAELIEKYSWPGNVRQLKNSVERAALLESDDWIRPEDLRIDLGTDHENSKNKENGNSINKIVDADNFQFPTKGIALEQLEKNIILSALDKASGNLSHAARLLKISRGKLRYRLEKLKIDLVS